MTEQVFQTRYETYRTAVESYLADPLCREAGLAGPVRVHAVQPAGRGQAHPAGADPGVRPPGGAGGLEDGPARGLRTGAGPHLLPDPRRPALHGQRRPAPGQAHQPQGLRRDAGRPGGRRPPAGGLPPDPDGAGAGRRPPGRLRPHPGGSLRRGRHGGGPGAGHPPRPPDRGGGDGGPPPQDRGHDRRGLPSGRGRRRRRGGPDGRRPNATPRSWAWPSRSGTTCWTCAATRTEFGKPIGSDKEEGKVTFVDLLGLEGCGRAVRAHTEAAKAAVADFDADGFLAALADSLAERNK